MLTHGELRLERRRPAARSSRSRPTRSRSRSCRSPTSSSGCSTTPTSTRPPSIAYAESIDKLAANFLEVNPHCFGAVPRVYEKVHARIMAKAEAGSPIKKKLFALGGRRSGASASPTWSAGEPLPSGLAREGEDRRRARLQEDPGGPRDASFRVRRLGRRAALARPRGVLHRRRRPDLRGLRPDGDLAGHLRQRPGPLAARAPSGRPLRGVEVRIAADGEILTRGPHIMKGYFKKPEATAEAIDADGWFHTGDIGELDATASSSITDRKKDLIVLAGGKKAAPQPIENELKKSPFIGLPIVIGDRQKFLAALIVPNFDRLKEWAAASKLDVRLGGARRATRRSARLFQGEIDAYNADKPHHEQIRAFAILPAGPDDRGRLDHADPQGQAAHPREPVPRADRGDVRRRPESRMSREVVVVDGLRTPYARAGTELKDVPAERARPDRRSAELLARTDFDPGRARPGHLRQHRAAPGRRQRRARRGAARPACRRSVPAFTVNRLCGSGLQSIVDAYYRIAAGRRRGDRRRRRRVDVEHPAALLAREPGGLHRGLHGAGPRRRGSPRRRSSGRGTSSPRSACRWG